MKRSALALALLAAACAPHAAPAPAPEPAAAAPATAPAPPAAPVAVMDTGPAFRPLPLVTWGPTPPGTPHAERQHDFDLQHQAVHVRFDWPRHAVVGTTTLRVAAVDRPLSAVALDAVGMEIGRVTDAAGRTLRHDYDGHTLTVHLRAPVAAGAATGFTVAYQAVRPKKGAYFIDRQHVMWTQGETEDTRYWVPTYDYPDDKTTWEFFVTTAANEKALSNGRLAGSRPVPGGVEWHWTQERPASTYLYSVVTGNYVVVQDHWNEVPVDYWTYPDSVEAARRGFGRTPAAIDVFSRKTGVPYPWAKYDQSVTPDYIFGGMENVTATTQLDDGILHPAWAEPNANADGLMAHELGHQWYGDLLTTKDWGHIWLNEGFATFMEQTFREADRGVDEGAWDRMGAQEQVLRADRAARRPIVFNRWVVDPLEVFFSGHIYPKGATILQMMRHRLGEDRFWRAMNLYTTRHAYQNVVSDDLRQAFDESTGESWAPFFAQWVYAAGFPAFRVRARYDAAAGTVRLTADQVQPVDSLTPYFNADVDVEVLTDRGPVRQVVAVRGQHTEATLAVPAEPRSIRFDEGGWLLKVLDFPRSTAMLAYQLQHDGDVIGRAEAVAELARRTGDVAALAALAAASHGDRFWGVRQRATQALAAFAAHADAQAAVLAATRDPDPRIRVSAAGALARFSGAAVTARLGELVNGDPSRFVHGTAIISYATVDPEGALPFIRSMLGRESWVDVERSAAVQALGMVDRPESFEMVMQYLAPRWTRPVRTTAIAALVQRAHGREAQAARAIEPLLNEESDLFVRSAAAQALGELKQPSSAAALEARRRVEAESRVVNLIDASLQAIRGG
jgi:aminopeptidase N